MMDASFPPPLAPPHVDLRDFTFMPLDVLRLRDSDIAVEATGEEFRAAVLLWCAAWHQIPAGSLPDNDARLGQFAGYGRVTSAWLEVKDGALRGFVKCADGRLYHPVIVEKALEAWEKKQAHAERKEADRQRKAKKNDAGTSDPADCSNDRPPNAGVPTPAVAQAGGVAPSDPSGEPGGRGKTSAGTPPEFQRNAAGIPVENALKGQGQGQESGAAADAGADPPMGNFSTSENSAISTPALAVVRALDDAIAAAFGPDKRRPWPDATDRVLAQRWLDAGADQPLIADVLVAVCRRSAAANRTPPKSLKYFDQAVTDALADRDAPTPKPSQPPQNGGHHAGRSAPSRHHGGTTRNHVDDDARRRGILHALGIASGVDAG